MEVLLRQESELLINPPSLIALKLRGYCQAIVGLLSLHELSLLSHTIEDFRSCHTPSPKTRLMCL